MARTFNKLSIQILSGLLEHKGLDQKALYKNLLEPGKYKDFYNSIFRLEQLGLVTKNKTDNKLAITAEGEKILSRTNPVKDGVWKLVIFDIPEKHKYVRSVLRAKLKALHFKKWQNSIWVSPYKLDVEIENEMKELAKKFFVRLIKTTDINEKKDLEKLF